MKIANKKTALKVGRPSKRTITIRRSDKHISFGCKCVEDLGLKLGAKVGFVFFDNDIFIIPDCGCGLTLYGYKNGQKYTSLVCTAKNVVLEILDKIKADKVAVFAVSANHTIINRAKAYKVIKTPLRLD